MWDKHQGLKKLTKSGGHPEPDQSESIVNQWTLALKDLGLWKSFGRAHQTLRKVREHIIEPKKTANPIPRHPQKKMSRLKKRSHADKYRFFNLLTFFRNLGKEQQTDQHQDAKGKKDNRLKQRGHYSVSHIIKLLSTKNLEDKQKTDRHQVEKGKKDNRLQQSHIIKLLREKNRKYARFA